MQLKRLFLHMLLCACAPLAPVVAQLPDIISTKVSGDTITITDAHAMANCASRFAIEVKVTGNRITMTECDTVGPLANCICEYTVTARVWGLTTGMYIIDVERRYEQRYGYGGDWTMPVGTVTDSVVHGMAPPSAWDGRQTDCLATGLRDVVSPDFHVTASPNPFHDIAIITYTLEKAAPVTIDVFNAEGRRILGYDLGIVMPGVHRWLLPTAKFPAAGKYFCRVGACDRTGVVPLYVMK
jgi:hypothetical protein